MNSNGRPIQRFAARLACFLAIQMVVGAVVIRYGRPGNSEHYLSAIEDKIERLKSCDGPRIVTIGGSNVAFGIHSPIMQDSLGIESVNLGLNLALGLPFQLECYLQHAHPGDIVILSPEYQLLTCSEHQQGNALIIDYMLLQYPQAKRYLNRSRTTGWKTFLDSDGLWAVHQWVGRAFKTMRDEDTTDQIYHRSAFNECGDVVAHYGHAADRPISVGPVPQLTEESEKQTLALLNRFHRECREKGVHVYLSYPPILESDYDNAEAFIEQLHQTLAENVTIPILHHPRQFAHSYNHFFDTGYHLNQQAGEARTLYLAAAIEREHFGPPLIVAANGRE